MTATFERRAIGLFAMLLGAGALSCGGAAPPSIAPACGGRSGTTIVQAPSAYGGGAGGWYDPGDYPPFIDDGGDDSGDVDPGDDSGGDPTMNGDDSSSGDNSGGDDSSGDDSSGDDSSGDDSSDSSMRIHPRPASTDRVRTRSLAGARPLDALVCSSCTVVCTLDRVTPDVPPAGVATYTSGDPRVVPCAVAQGDVARWSHQTFGVRVIACEVVASTP